MEPDGLRSLDVALTRYCLLRPSGCIRSFGSGTIWNAPFGLVSHAGKNQGSQLDATDSSERTLMVSPASCL